MIRTRWAAVGAAVAVTLGAGGIGLVSATSPSDAVAFVPIEPCRLVDTRPGDFNVGGRTAPFGPDETVSLDAHGDNGECTGIPATATGLGLNVTAVDPSAATVLTIWGSGDQPNASSLNPTPGSPPTPNAVTSGLSGTGQLNIWNAFGNVHVIVDIVGYYTDHDHDDRYYTEAEVDALTAPQPIVFSHGTNDLTPNASSSISIGYFAGGSTLSGTGLAQISLTGPHQFDGATYELTSVEYCVSSLSGGAIVDNAVVYIHGINLAVGPSASDGTDRTTPGCYTLAVGLTNEQGFDFGVRKAGGGSMTITGLTTTWSPVAP